MSTFEYSRNWERTKKRCKKVNCRCSQNPLHSGNIVVHHLKYSRSIPRRLLGILLFHNPFQKSVSGLEIIGWDIITVCAECHKNSYGRSRDRRSVHHSDVWIQRGGLGNRNILLMRMQLRMQFWIGAIVQIPFRILGMIGK